MKGGIKINLRSKKQLQPVFWIEGEVVFSACRIAENVTNRAAQVDFHHPRSGVSLPGTPAAVPPAAAAGRAAGRPANPAPRKTAAGRRLY